MVSPIDRTLDRTEVAMLPDDYGIVVVSGGGGAASPPISSADEPTTTTPATWHGQERSVRPAGPSSVARSRSSSRSIAASVVSSSRVVGVRSWGIVSLRPAPGGRVHSWDGGRRARSRGSYAAASLRTPDPAGRMVRLGGAHGPPVDGVRLPT
jgi:hypothetical protein